MNHKTRKWLRAIAFAVVATVSAGFFTACDDDIDESNRFTFKGELIATYLKNNPERFSSFTKILSKARIGKKSSGNLLETLSTYGSYTCFAPTNEAVDTFLKVQYELYNQGERTGIFSPYLEDLTDSMATEIAKNHIIELGYLTTDINEGAFPKSTMNRRFTTVEWINDDEGRVFPLLNNSALIIEQDLEKENGYVQVVNGVLNPSNKLLNELIESQKEAFGLFNEAIIATGIDSLLMIYEIEPEYDNTLFGPKMGSENSLTPYPVEKKQRYTVLIEPDALYNEYGITTLDELTAFAEKYYGTEAQGDYKNPENALHKFILYHIIDRQLLYSSSTGPGGFLMESYDNNGFQSERTLTTNFDRYEYYETMLPYTMIKVTKPFTNEALKKEIVINYAQEKGRRVVIPEMAGHLNVIVEKAQTTKDKYPELADFDQSALNGIIHTIDRIIIYNEEEMRGNVLNERIRMDASALFPELTNNSVRWDVQIPGTKLTYIPGDFCKGFVVNNNDTKIFYLRPHQTWNNTYANYQGDELIVEGKYDFKYRIPHVPEGDYEIRFCYPKGYQRGVCQFYVDGKIAGIPVDLRWTDATDALIGAVSDEGLSEEQIKENDKAMRNRGYMKGPKSIFLDDGISMRDGEQPIRKIVGVYKLNKGDHWMRFKDVSDKEVNTLKQFDQDYLELVPLSVISDPTKPEDIY